MESGVKDTGDAISNISAIRVRHVMSEHTCTGTSSGTQRIRGRSPDSAADTSEWAPGHESATGTERSAGET